MNCSDCGAPMVRMTKKVSWVYRGQRLEYKQPGLFCSKCENSSLSDQDAAATQAVLISFKVKVDEEATSLITPD
jgi:hypothetical protein